MSPEEQRIKIAEATGRKFGRDIGYTHAQANLIYKPDPRGVHAGNDSKKYSPDYGFDPLNDLNAMHEAEKVITDWWAYHDHLHEIVYTGLAHDKDLIHATANQRAEAFLRALNLWKE